MFVQGPVTFGCLIADGLPPDLISLHQLLPPWPSPRPVPGFIMASRLLAPSRRIGFALAAGVLLFSAFAIAKEALDVGELSVGQIEDELQVNKDPALPPLQFPSI